MHIRNKRLTKLASLFTALVITVSISAVSVNAQSIMKGDIDGDGKVTASDAMATLRYSVGAASFTEEQKKIADVNNDGEVRVTDAMAILRYVVGFSDAISDDNINQTDPFIQEVVRLVNLERAKENISPLQLDEELNLVAKIRAEEIVSYFSHTRPDGRSCFTVLNENGVSYRTAGENIASGYSTPEMVVKAWMDSEGHRENIMNPNFTKIGIGHLYINNSQYGHYWTQMFIG